MNEAPKTREIQLTGASMQFLCTSNLDVTLTCKVNDIQHFEGCDTEIMNVMSMVTKVFYLFKDFISQCVIQNIFRVNIDALFLGTL